MKKKFNIKSDCRGMNEVDIFNTILADRGIEDVEHFLNPTEDDLLPLDSLPNINKAYSILMQYIKNENHITILADVDVDGITSGAIIYRYLRNYTDNISIYINEGKAHGLIGQDLERFNEADLVIIVDSLDADCSAYKHLVDNGKEIIVLDHHVVDTDIPYNDYITLVTSQVDYDNKALSGAGVVWKFCKYIDEQELNEYADELVDLAACGLVADMMDVTVPENRYIISKGLEKINNLALKKIIGGFEFNSTAIAFSVAPLINACNRMNKNETALKAFLSDDNKEVLACMKVLKKCKEEQNNEVASLMDSVTKQCEEQLDKKMITVFVDTPYGIAGLIGNKILERYKRPLLILKDNDDSYSGSMRAVGVEDFRQMCEDSGLADAKGHELASGITIPKENYEKFTEYIENELKDLDLSTEVDVDIRLDISDVNKTLINYIKQIDKISGTGFKPVKVYINGITEYEIGQMSDYKHLVLKPNPYTYIIKWNFTGSFDEFEDHSLMNDEVEIVATLDSGFLGRNFVLKLVCDELMTN